MRTEDYREAAFKLRSMRVELLMRQALQPPTRMDRVQHLRLWVHVHNVLTWHEYLRAPSNTTYDVLRQNRHTILNK